MMLTVAQRELLDSFIADEGIYFETIRDYPGLNLGTKVLYLERAISQNCQTFLQSLDKLYQPGLDGEAKTAHIEFIRALKVINDLYFDNQVKYDEFGTRAALTHYFGSLGNIVPGDFQTTIQGMITAGITALSEAHEEEVTAQKQARVTAEVNIAPEIGWREELDLPLAQLGPDILVIQALNSVLSSEQYQSLSAEVQQVIANNTNRTRELVQKCGASFAQIQRLTGPELQQLFDHSGDVARLVCEAHIALADLLALDQPIRAELLNSSYDVTLLVSKANVTLDNLIDPELGTELLHHPLEVTKLVNEAKIPYARLLSSSIRAELFKGVNAYTVISFLNKAYITFDGLEALPQPIRTELLKEPNSITLLVDEAHIPFTDLAALSQPILAKLLNSNHSHAVVRLMDKADIPFADLAALDQPILAELLKNSSNVLRLVKTENISFELLSHLSVPQLRTVLNNPDSEESQAILNPPSSSCRIL
jgi:predicted nucleic acid-binding protein